MPKSAVETPPAVPAEATEPGPEQAIVMLDEFCAELSTNVRRVELLAGFHAASLAAGRPSATREAFRRAFDAYLTRPIS